MTIAPPDRPFDAYEPSDSEPWNARRVNHLLRRAAIASGHGQVGDFLKLTPGKSVDTLLDYDITQDPYNPLLDQLDGFFNFQSIDMVQGWFFFRMLSSARRAQERMALFWHNHFATSASKVEQAKLMHNQIELFRQKGLGSFQDLLFAVATDPAMLIWLDGQSNKKGHANENFGREVMELFTLGIGNYTEKDVQELARAFTGWKNQGETSSFDPKQWDSGDKTIFGVTGKFDTKSAIALILKQPAATKFIAHKMLRDFVYPDPPDDHIEHYAGRLVYHDWRIKPVLKEIFTSRMFYSPWAYRSRIKSPVELAVGAALAMGGKCNCDYLNRQTDRMGQKLLFPPNVKGWDGNEAWINANTVLVRFNFALALATQRGQGGQVYAKQPDLESELKSHGVATAEDVVNYMAALLQDGWLAEDDKERFIDFLENPPVAAGQHVPAFSVSANSYRPVRDLMHMMMSMPEYQLS